MVEPAQCPGNDRDLRSGVACSAKARDGKRIHPRELDPVFDEAEILPTNCALSIFMSLAKCATTFVMRVSRDVAAGMLPMYTVLTPELEDPAAPALDAGGGGGGGVFFSPYLTRHLLQFFDQHVPRYG